MCRLHPVRYFPFACNTLTDTFAPFLFRHLRRQCQNWHLTWWLCVDAGNAGGKVDHENEEMCCSKHVCRKKQQLRRSHKYFELSTQRGRVDWGVFLCSVHSELSKTLLTIRTTRDIQRGNHELHERVPRAFQLGHSAPTCRELSNYAFGDQLVKSTVPSLNRWNGNKNIRALVLLRVKRTSDMSNIVIFVHYALRIVGKSNTGEICYEMISPRNADVTKCRRRVWIPRSNGPHAARQRQETENAFVLVD